MATFSQSHLIRLDSAIVSIATVECVENDNYCPRTCDCIAREVWAEVQKAVMAVLESMTLQSLIDKAKHDKTLHYQI